jgi:response regulator RpfG family c-di-GMP phosphodiesterase
MRGVSDWHTLCVKNGGGVESRASIRTRRHLRMKILLVDDERGFLNVMGDVLRQNGYDVIAAENGKQAREVLESESVDLIISDVFMPTLNGVRFHSYVRDFTDAHDVPFIFMSGYDDETTRNLVVNPERDFFFSKSTPIEKVIAFIGTLKDSRSAPKS